jgi:glyoxylase-like metal-dependent hydrolase (beta-lactamase superfamily II)
MKWNGLDVEQINDLFYVIRQRTGCNIGVLTKDGSALVLDSGYSPKGGSTVSRMIREQFGCQIELLFNTHYHSDHTFGNQAFDCPILSSATCRDTMEACLSSHWTTEEIAKAKKEDPSLEDEWSDLSITLPTETFEERRLFSFHGIEMIFEKVGGHTPGSSTVLLPHHKILFSGDLIFGELYPTLLFDGNPFELTEALKRIIETEMEIIVPGHGATCAKRTVTELIAYWECLISNCRELTTASMSDDDAVDALTNRCHLQSVAFNEMKHRRNVNSVVNFMRQQTS